MECNERASHRCGGLRSTSPRSCLFHAPLGLLSRSPGEAGGSATGAIEFLPVLRFLEREVRSGHGTVARTQRTCNSSCSGRAGPRPSWPLRAPVPPRGHQARSGGPRSRATILTRFTVERVHVRNWRGGDGVGDRTGERGAHGSPWTSGGSFLFGPAAGKSGSKGEHTYVT